MHILPLHILMHIYTFSQRNFLHFLATNPSRGLNNLGPKTKLISPRVVFLIKRKNFFVYASRHFSSLNLVVKKNAHRVGSHFFFRVF